MTGMDWLVIAGGIAAIAWVNWYFLAVPRRVGSRGDDGGQEGSSR